MYHAVLDELHDHRARRLVALGRAGDATDPRRTANLLVLRLELNPRSRRLLDLLYHVAALPDDHANQTPWHRNLFQHKVRLKKT